MEALCGEVGIGLPAYYEMTPREFYNVSKGIRKRQDEEYRDGWERTRRIMWASLVPHQKKGKTLKLTDVVLFPWEKEETDAFASTGNELAEAEAAQEEWAALDAKREAKRLAGTLKTEKVALGKK